MNNRLMLSDSQREVLKLAEVIGDEANVLSLIILFPSCDHADILVRAADIIALHHPMLHAVIDAEHLSYSYSDQSHVVQNLMLFSTREELNEWAKQRTAQAMNKEVSCAEITPLQISNEAEGYFVRLHHAVADGWAMSLIFQRLTDAYRRMLDGFDPATPVAPRYEDFVIAERAHLQSARGKREASFWRGFLSAHRENALLSDTVSHDFSSKRFSAPLSNQTAQALAAIAAKRNRTLQSILLTAAAAAYSRMREAQRFCMGVLLLNRQTEAELETVGNFFTTAPLPITVSSEETFLSLNEEVSDSLFSMLRRSRTSYSRIIQNAFDQIPAAPLFDMLVNYQDYSAINTQGVEFVWYAPARQLETLQLSFLVTQDSIRLLYDYRPDRISLLKVKQLHARICAVLEDIVDTGWEKSIDSLPQVSSEQLKQLERWNQTDHPYPSGETLYSLFEKQAENSSDQVALYFADRKMTYGELEQQVRCLASLLLHEGIKPGQIIGLMMERSFEMVVAMYAIIRCGGAYMPIATDSPQDRALFMLLDSDSPMLLTQSWQKIELPDGIVRLDVDKLNLNQPVSYTPSLAMPELPAYVIYTSGSTGTPKGVLIAHHSIVDRIHWMNRTFGMRSTDVVLQKTPYTFDVSVWEFFWWSGYGGALAIMPPDAHKDPEQIICMVERYHITKLHFVPSMLSAFLAYAGVTECRERLHSLQQVFASGEALLPAHVQKFYRLLSDTELINLYGPTECTVDVSCFRCSKTELSSVPIGKPVDNTKLYVVDSQCRMLPIGSAGELCVAGNLVGIGYLNRPELTQTRFSENPFGSGKLYHTGDLACWNEQGEIEYLGRMDFQVKLRGQRIELGEIERRMVEIPGILEAVAAVQNPGSTDAQLVAYYTGSKDFHNADLQKELERVLPHYMIPQGFMHMAEFSKTTSGKTDRKALPSIIFAENRPGELPDPPVTPLQIRLCNAFAAALGISEDEVGLSFDFFENGGTSLTAIMLLTDLFAEYPMQLKDIYLHPTPGRLSSIIQKESLQTDAKLDSYDEDYAYTNISAVHLPNPGIPTGKSILITGTTGFLGIHILFELLSLYPDTTMICLVRDEEKLRRHWSDMLGHIAFPTGRVILIHGDLTQPKMGMSDEDYQFCCRNVAAVYHCAADVRHFGHWETLYSINTLGTRRVIELCLAADASLHHISTISVNGYVLTTMEAKLTDEFTEDHLFVGQRYRENVYVHSKYLAEKSILDARKNGLKANIYRVGNLLWRKSDGRFQSNREAHDFYMLTHAFLRLGVNVEEYANLEVDLTAVDSASHAIVLLSTDSLNQVYHIMTPYTVTWQQYLEMLTGKAFPILPMKQFTELLQKHANEPDFGFLIAYFATLSSMDASMFPVERNRKTINKLTELGFEWEHPTAEYARFIL